LNVDQLSCGPKQKKEDGLAAQSWPTRGRMIDEMDRISEGFQNHSDEHGSGVSLIALHGI
jgi:hypothetical protein